MNPDPPADRTTSTPSGEVSTNQVRQRLADILKIVSDELPASQPRIWWAAAVTRLLPAYSMFRFRAQLLRLAGWRIGPGAALFGSLTMYGPPGAARRLVIGNDGMINIRCTFDLTENVTIGNNVALGHEVMILTSSHQLGRRSQRAAASHTAPVVIGDGAWIGSRTVILPGVTIGDGAVVMSGSVVNADVAANSMVAGIPATVVVKRLPG